MVVDAPLRRGLLVLAGAAAAAAVQIGQVRDVGDGAGEGGKARRRIAVDVAPEGAQAET